MSQDVINSALEGDTSAIVNAINGGLDNANIATGANINATKLLDGSIVNAKISGAAAILVTKLAQTAGQLDSDIVDDSADDAATYKTVTTPGTSASPSLPTNLQQEWERIRYQSLRQALGVNAKITSGSTSAAWFDGVAIGPNLIRNGSFLDGNATPDGWTVNGAPDTQELVTLPVTEGFGKGIRLLDGSGAVTDGMETTLTSLKASTLYLIAVRVLDTTADVDITTTGATGTFGNLAMSADAGAYQTAVGLISTDATPAPIVLSIEPDATSYDFTVAWASCHEVSVDDLGKRGGEITLFASSVSTEDGSAGFGTVEAALSLSVVAPSPGYKIIAQLTIQGEIDSGVSGSNLKVELEENTTVKSTGYIEQEGGTGYGTKASVHLVHVNEAPVPGTVYTYAPDLTPSSADAVIGLSQDAATHTLVVQLVRS